MHDALMLGDLPPAQLPGEALARAFAQYHWQRGPLQDADEYAFVWKYHPRFDLMAMIDFEPGLEEPPASLLPQDVSAVYVLRGQHNPDDLDYGVAPNRPVPDSLQHIEYVPWSQVPREIYDDVRATLDAMTREA
ncbi:hypothetical protein O6R08_06610 [Cutibacterium equinum]|uniref:Uncharacterized protein n=1 Tax=Cutibacterium equinum TaxID=3016342 RepID=A0ABY7QXU9_9ACTN|nr:hypothetical protein [Cutibacterium equinum]WCC79218.1 hypothetical protein O6R08_06610 [Cutibacterium equinum]